MHKMSMDSRHSCKGASRQWLMMILVIAFAVLVGRAQAVSFYGRTFDGDTEFVPLEEQQQHQQQQSRRADTLNLNKPFDLDVVTGELGGNTDVDSHRPSIFLQQSFPFFGNDFFNSFAGFGIGGGAAQEPWWKGPNVCTNKEEDEKVISARDTAEAASNDGSSSNGDAVEEIAPGVAESIDVRPPLFGQFHFSVNSCVEKPNKYICSRIQNQNGKRKRITITRQCCHGYGRSRNADFATPCEKLEIKDIEAAASDMGAKQFIANVKSSGMGDELLKRKNLTLFMPMDDAYTQYQDQMQSENNVVKSDERFYRRHVVDGELSLYDAQNEQILQSEEDGQSIRINAYQLPRSLGREPFQYTANCVPVERHDKMSEQGLIHTLNGVLPSVTKNVMDIIRQRPDLSIMRTVLETTKMHEMLEADKPVTIFVPTDDAFDKLEPHLRRALKEGKGCASNILKNHIVDLTFCSVAALPNAKTTAYNLLGEAMQFNRSKAATPSSTDSKSEKLEAQPLQPVVINGLAKIIDADIMGTNGVLHVIDTILPTESALPMSTLMQEKNVTLFKRLVEAAGLDNKFDDMDNITIFAPTDKALQNTKWAQMLNESPDQLKDNSELKEFLSYHVVTPMTKTCDLTEQVMPTMAGPNVRVNLYSTHSLFSNVMNRATVNCARLVHFDDESCGSVLHQVDKALAPPKSNLLALLESNPNYSKFLELVRSANLSQLLAQDSDEVYTLLVPKNEVFEEIEDWQNTLSKDKRELEQLVKTHIVNDAVCCAGIIPTNWPFVRSIEALNGVHLRITRDRRPKVENAGITKCDAIATNGIVHEINDIIVPTRRRPESQPPQQPFEHHLEQFGDLFI